MWQKVILGFMVMVVIFQFNVPFTSLVLAQPKDTIVDEWATVKVPPPPEIKPVTIDPKTTAFLILDIQNQTCSSDRRPRCVASIPKIQNLLNEARAKGMPVIYSLIRDSNPADIRKELSPLAGEPVVSSGVDKFFGTELEKILKEKNIKAVILVGTAAHGAVLHTAAGAAMRGLQVIVPVDGMSAEDPYAEQYTAWHLVNSPGTRRQAVLTRIGLIQF